MLEVTRLHASYGSVNAVRDVSLVVDSGAVTLVLGSNGAGKTTTLRAIAGLHREKSGTITLDGEDIATAKAHRIVQLGMALVPQGRRIFAPLTIEENLKMGAYSQKVYPRQTLARVYDMFPILASRRRSQAGLLSGGEQQMLAFGRALMSQPRVMLMDEPSMGLAPAVVEAMIDAVRSIADSGIAVLLIEQNAELGMEVADQVTVMSRGEMVFAGTAAEARENRAVVRAFLGEAALVESAAGPGPRDARDHTEDAQPGA